MSELTEEGLKEKLALFGDLTDEQRNKIVCSLVGHSRIKNHSWGYWYCGRCEEQVGDSLGGAYTGLNDVLIGHDCKTCRDNAAKLTWHDTLFAPEPFKAEEVEQ